MAGTTTFKKRSRDDAPRSKASRPSKKQKKLQRYHSDSEEEDAADNAANDDGGEDFQAVNLLDSDEDLNNAQVDDGASSAPSSSDSDEEEAPKKRKFARDAPAASDRDSDADSDSGDGDSDEDGEGGGARRKSKSKRNDPSAFATSLSKILSTKLSSSRRADPVLARSADAHETSRQIVDSALESKARRRMREQKRLAMEKGRVKDVLVATGSSAAVEDVQGGGEETTTAQILETERRLRKVAQRGVVKLFNAVRAAQVKASEAERLARTEGVVGVDRKKEKVTEMSRKGFLDLIASGGGGLKKGKLEEA